MARNQEPVMKNPMAVPQKAPERSSRSGYSPLPGAARRWAGRSPGRPPARRAASRPRPSRSTIGDHRCEADASSSQIPVAKATQTANFSSQCLTKPTGPAMPMRTMMAAETASRGDSSRSRRGAADRVRRDAHDDELEDRPPQELEDVEDAWAGRSRGARGGAAGGPSSAFPSRCRSSLRGRGGGSPGPYRRVWPRSATPRPRPGTRKVPASITRRPIPKSPQSTA